MSLLLRKACQSTLDKYDLDDSHTAISKNDNCMQIVGPCGKPLFTVSGITFTRTNPGKEEINFANDLLNDFLMEHSKGIIKLTTAKVNVDKAKKVSTELPDNFIFNQLTEGYGNNEKITGYCVVYTVQHEDVNMSEKFKIRSDCNLENITYDYECTGFHLSSVADAARDKKVVKQMNTVLVTHSLLHREIYIYDKILSKLQSCDI